MALPGSRQSSGVTPEWLSDLASRILGLSIEAETRFGEPGQGCYPSDVEMLLGMAHQAAHRRAQEMKDAVPLPPPSREELFTDG